MAVRALSFVQIADDQMMDAHRPCPDSALLAAFLDGTLADYERTAVVTHLAECPECRAVALTVVEFREVEALDALWDRSAAPVTPTPLVEGGETRWTREKTRAPAILVAAVAATAVLAIPFYFLMPARSAQQAVTTLIAVAEEQRPVEARLSGALAYAPPPASVSRHARDDRARVQLIAAASNIRNTYEHDDGAPSRRAVGVAALLTGDLDEAIATLEIAVAAEPQDRAIANDLAASYYERSQRANRPDDLPAALSAVERVLHADPAHAEALFNRALIITALGLRAEAEAAWRAYIAQDPESPWAEEARQRLQALAPLSTVPTWATVRQALETSNTASDAEVAVRHHASAARNYVENELLKRWVQAAKARDGNSANDALNRIRTLAIAFDSLSGDRLYQDFITSAQFARDNHTQEQYVAAHEEYLNGLTLMAGQRFAEAKPVLERACVQLLAVRSPFSARLRIEAAAADYYSFRHKEALAALAEVKALATKARHADLVTRAEWLSGMSAYALNEFARAQIAYEAMLASATAAGDTDSWVMAHVLLANLHDTLGDATRAWQHRVSAATRLDDVFSQLSRLAYMVSASGDASAGEHDGAALLFQSLVIDAGTSVAPNLDVQVRSQRARSLLRLGRRMEARGELERARERLAAIPNSDNRLRVEADVLSVEADMRQNDDRAHAIAAVERLLTLPIIRQDHLRRARAQLQLANALFDDGDIDRAESVINDGLAALETFRSSPSAEFAIRASDPVWGLFGRAAQIALRRGDLARAFVYADRARMRSPQERRTWAADIASVQDLQRVLPRDVALITLTQLDDGLQVWVIRKNDMATHTAPITRPRAAALVATQQKEMLRGAAAPRVSAELFDVVFRPVLEVLADATNLVVVADAPYNRIAFAGLWDRQSNRFVVEDHTVVLAPSATAYASAAARSHSRTRSPLRLASVLRAPGEQFGSHGRRAIAESLAAMYGTDRVTRHERATASELVESVAQDDVVHLAGQVLANERFPGLSRVQMADDPGKKYSGAVFARRVEAAAPVRAQLVAIENGARGSITSQAEGTLTFARALLAAGVSNVVSPIADIESSRVEQTWVDFHRHYAAGTAAAESLRRAQLAALSESNRRPGPWATLTVFGSAQ